MQTVYIVVVFGACRLSFQDSSQDQNSQPLITLQPTRLFTGIQFFFLIILSLPSLFRFIGKTMTWLLSMFQNDIGLIDRSCLDFVMRNENALSVTPCKVNWI